MSKECIVCGNDLYLEKHHPDGKIQIYLTRNPQTNKVIEFDIFDNYRSFIEDNRQSWAQWSETVHINPDNWVWVCGTCHGVLRSERFTLDILKEAHRWSQMQRCRLTREMLELHAIKNKLMGNVIQLDKHYRNDSKNTDYLHNQEILKATDKIDKQLKLLCERQQRGV